MKNFATTCFVFAVQALVIQAEERVFPPIEPLSQEVIGELLERMRPENKLDISLARRGLVSAHLTLRACSARYMAHHGTWDDVSYLIDALSDESMHVGASYVYAGMATTRYWANVALVAICKMDMGYRWDDSIEYRKKAIDNWKQQLELHQRTKNG